MTPEDLGLPNSATRIERMGDGPLEASGLHPAANMAAKRAGMTPDAWVRAASGEQGEGEPGHGLEHEPLDQDERDAEHTAQNAARMSQSGLAQEQPAGPRETSVSAPRFAPNLGGHPMERFAAGGRWVTREELGGAG